MSASNGWHWLQAKTGYVGPSDYGDVPGYVDPSDYGDVPGYVAPSEGANGAHRVVSANKAIKAAPFVFGDPRQIPPREWLYGRHYARKFLSMTVAPGGSGKSALVIGEALAMATGKNLLGVLPDKPSRVWYLNGEDPMDELQRRFAAAGLHHKINTDDIRDRLYINSGRDAEIILARDDRSGIKIAGATIDALRREIHDRQIDVLIIDPLVAFHNVPENDNGKINAAVCQPLRMLAEETRCAIELVHHVRKAAFGQGEYTVDDARGAGSLLAAARSGRTLNTMTKDEAVRAGVENRKSYFRVDNGKGNNAPPAENSVWHRIGSVLLGNGEHGGDSIGVVTMWNWPDPNEDVTPDDMRAVQAAVSAGEWRESSQAKNWAGYAIADALGLDRHEPAVRVKVKALLRSWLENGLLKIVERKDTTRKVRAFVEVGKKNAIVPAVEW